MEFLAAEVWVLFWVAFTFAMLGYAYYSQNHATQWVALYILLTFALSHIFDFTSIKLAVFVGMDIAGLVWCVYVWRRFENSDVARHVAGIFALMLVTHYAGAQAGFTYDLVLSVLYAAQLIVLCGYSKKYGKVARQSPPQHRDDPFYKMEVWLKPVH